VCHCWYVLRRGIMYTEPNLAKPSTRLSAGALGHKKK
jgi:hypothetical protein